jgi:hypothetical protein
VEAQLRLAIGVPVRVHDRHGDDLGVAHVPTPVRVGDVVELGRGELLPLRIVDVVETPAHSAIAALVRVIPWPRSERLRPNKCRLSATD